LNSQAGGATAGIIPAARTRLGLGVVGLFGVWGRQCSERFPGAGKYVKEPGAF